MRAANRFASSTLTDWSVSDRMRPVTNGDMRWQDAERSDALSGRRDGRPFLRHLSNVPLDGAGSDNSISPGSAGLPSNTIARIARLTSPVDLHRTGSLTTGATMSAVACSRRRRFQRETDAVP
ncbi:hypothetical protein B0G77_6845 [Paraburkholderia sp. BL10I2N1]|nr:hypothetical protein B0G77_6845 [Paraburkholderia sp. BL10I2N1]